jgi:hypothetical protein
MSEMTHDIFAKTRAGLQYMEFKLKEYEQEIERLSLDVAILKEELERERQPKRDER